MKRFWIFISYFLAICTPILAQVVEASVDKRRVSVGEVFQLKLMIRDDAVAQFTPPNLSDFVIVAGPNRMISQQIVNGQRSSSFALTYELRARREGKFQINGAVMRQGKNTYRQNIAVEVEVGKSAPTTATATDTQQPVFLKVETPTKNVFVGQQITLDVKLYAAVSIRNLELISEPTYQNFFYQSLTEFSRDDVETNIGGKRFAVRTLARVAIFPQKSGKLAIEPFQIQAFVAPTPNPNDPLGSMMQDLQAVRLASQPLEFDVSDTPPQYPPNFSGIVGKLDALAELNKTQGSTDEALSLRLTVRSNGDPKRLIAPTLATQSEFEFYEPKTLSERTTESGGEIWTTKIFEYLVIPKQTGSVSLNPNFNYFDPEKRTFLAANLPKFDLQIVQGTKTTAVISATEAARGQLSPIKMALSGSHTGGEVFGTTFWALVLVPFMALALAGFWRERQNRLAKIDPAELRRQSAETQASRHFKHAKSLVGQPNDAFFDAIGDGIYGYLGDKFGIEPSEFSIEMIENKLKNLEIEPDLTQNLLKILNQCEMARFGGSNFTATLNRQEMLNTATQIIEKIESIHKK